MLLQNLPEELQHPAEKRWAEAGEMMGPGRGVMIGILPSGGRKGQRNLLRLAAHLQSHTRTAIVARQFSLPMDKEWTSMSGRLNSWQKHRICGA